MDGLSLNVECIRELYPLLNWYFGFEYADINEELSSALWKTDYQITYFKTSNIDHLPSNFNIFFPTDSFDELISLVNSYDFTRNNTLGVLFMLLYFYSKNIRNCFYNIEESNVMEDVFIHTDKCKLYEFLLDNYKPYSMHNLPKAQITILYGPNSQVTIDNHDNWLYNLLKKNLHDDLTFRGRREYSRNEEAQKPRRAPSFSNFIAYNSYLLLITTVGSDKRYPVEFLKFIIDFCQLCDTGLIERQQTAVGMKEFLSHANRQYQGEPIPFPLVR